MTSSVIIWPPVLSFYFRKPDNILNNGCGCCASSTAPLVYLAFLTYVLSNCRCRCWWCFCGYIISTRVLLLSSHPDSRSWSKKKSVLFRLLSIVTEILQLTWSFLTALLDRHQEWKSGEIFARCVILLPGMWKCSIGHWGTLIGVHLHNPLVIH